MSRLSTLAQLYANSPRIAQQRRRQLEDEQKRQAAILQRQQAAQASLGLPAGPLQQGQDFGTLMQAARMQQSRMQTAALTPTATAPQGVPYADAVTQGYLPNQQSAGSPWAPLTPQDQQQLGAERMARAPLVNQMAPQHHGFAEQGPLPADLQAAVAASAARRTPQALSPRMTAGGTPYADPNYVPQNVQPTQQQMQAELQERQQALQAPGAQYAPGTTLPSGTQVQQGVNGPRLVGSQLYGGPEGAEERRRLAYQNAAAMREKMAAQQTGRFDFSDHQRRQLHRLEAEAIRTQRMLATGDLSKSEHDHVMGQINQQVQDIIPTIPRPSTDEKLSQRLSVRDGVHYVEQPDGTLAKQLPPDEETRIFKAAEAQQKLEAGLLENPRVRPVHEIIQEIKTGLGLSGIKAPQQPQQPDIGQRMHGLMTGQPVAQTAAQPTQPLTPEQRAQHALGGRGTPEQVQHLVNNFPERFGAAPPAQPSSKSSAGGGLEQSLKSIGDNIEQKLTFNPLDAEAIRQRDAVRDIKRLVAKAGGNPDNMSAVDMREFTRAWELVQGILDQEPFDATAANRLQQLRKHAGDVSFGAYMGY